MSLDLEPCFPSTADSPRHQLKPLILVERAKGLHLRRGVSSAVCRPSQEEPRVPSQAVDFPRKVIVNKPNSLFRARSEDGLPTPPQTPTLSADSYEGERGRSNSVLQYHLPFRTIRLSSSPDRVPSITASTEEPVPSIPNLDTSINSGGGVEGSQLSSHTIIKLPEKPTVRLRNSIPSSPPRPLSRMSWCSTTTTSSEKTIMAASPPWASHSPPRHHRRSQSFGNGQSRISLESRGSSGTFGVGLKGSSHSVLDQDSVAEVSEEDLEDRHDDDGEFINDPGILDLLKLNNESSKLLPAAVAETTPFGRPPMKQLFPAQTIAKESGQSTTESINAQFSSFKFPSSPQNPSIQTVLSAPASNPNMRMAISAPTAPENSDYDLTITPTRHRVFSLPTCMPSASPTETGVLNQLGGGNPMADSPASPAHPTLFEPRPRRVLRKSPSPSLPSIVPTSNPSPMSSTRTVRPPHRQHGGSLPTEDLLREVIPRRGSAATVDTTTTADTTASTGTVTSKRLRFRKSIGNLFSRLFLERRAPRGDINAP